jgi:hypothetical protein
VEHPIATNDGPNILGAGPAVLGILMRRAAAPRAVAILCGLLAYLTADRIASGQAGSTGGNVGKTDKSISGGENAQAPRARQTVKPDHASSNQLAYAAISGRWHWEAKCGLGNFQGEFEIGPVTTRQFTGRFLSDLPGPIADGHIAGEQVSFSRQVLGHWQPWTAVLRGASQMSGSLIRTDFGGDRCMWTGTKEP